MYCLGNLVAVVIGVSLSEPHIDRDNSPRTRNNGMSVSMYHLSRICRTLVPEIRVRPEMLHVFRYIDVLTCVIYNSNDYWSSGAIRVFRERLSTKICRWMRRHIVQIDSAYWDNGAVAARQGLPTCLCKSETTNGLTVLLFCDVKLDTELTIQCLHVYLWIYSRTDQLCGVLLALLAM